MDALKKPNCANSSPLTPLRFIERAATVFGDSPSIIYNDLTYTWAQTFRRCRQLASSISRISVRRGDVVSVLAPNIPATYELHFAATMAGAVINTINTRLDARTIAVILRHSEAKLVFVDYQLTNLIQEAISLLQDRCSNPHPQLVLIGDNSPSKTGRGPISGPASGSVSDAMFVNTYENMVESGDAEFNWVEPESDWDPLTLTYTSGTTSSPKGVVHSHRGTFMVTTDCLIEWGVPKQAVYLWTLPMFHANGWSFVWGMAAMGGTNICLRKFDASTIYTAIRAHGVTHMCGAPVVLNMLSSGSPLDSPVSIMTAGAPPPAAILLRTEALGFDVTHGYGLTETGGLATACSWKKQWNRLPGTERARLKARQGVRTIGMTAVDIVNPESGVSVPRDGLTQGEIVLKGGCIMLGYLKDPEATAKCIKNGWFYTGDVGVMHPDGYLEIKDRIKDVIISGGENISSVEVESVLYMHPAVNEAAVVGRPDEFWGEAPCAFVSLKDGHRKPIPTAEEVIQFCKGKLPGYMVPKYVVFKEDLPKTSTGKIQKYSLREYAKNMGFAMKSRM